MRNLRGADRDSNAPITCILGAARVMIAIKDLRRSVEHADWREARSLTHFAQEPASLRAAVLARWLDRVVLDLVRQLRWSYLPPLMVYLAAGIAGLTSVVGAFFIKEYLGLSAAFLAGLAFWAGLPWALKMPMGHVVDLMWRRKSMLVYLGATLIAASMGIMYGLIARPDIMTQAMSVEAWYIVSVLLAPVGYVVQDVVADAMTVEAVPASDEHGEPYTEAQTKSMHTTMQTLGRIAIISGLMIVAALNIAMFSGVSELAQADKAVIYARIYLFALAIPAISVLGVVLGDVSLRRRAQTLRHRDVDEERIAAMLYTQDRRPEPNWWILGGTAVFVAFSLSMGLSRLAFAQELTFAGSILIVGFLLHRLLLELESDARRALIGTAVIIFVFRAVPLPGPGVTWWEIDVLGFDQQFLAVLSLITSGLTLAGMVLLRPFIARHSIAYVVLLLSIAAGLFTLPNIGLYYGIHEWTQSWSGGVVDAHFIAILDTALESPLGQISMIPMLAWIAKNAPRHLKATFFAVMASFTNLALSASSLLTRYLNQYFVVTREIVDPATGTVSIPSDYGDVGRLLIAVTVITVAAPLIAIALVQISPLRTHE
ncbi:MAG: hypothetical protein ACR2RL_05570 [Gammaproteobacteria bacterium]